MSGSNESANPQSTVVDDPIDQMKARIGGLQTSVNNKVAEIKALQEAVQTKDADLSLVRANLQTLETEKRTLSEQIAQVIQERDAAKADSAKFARAAKIAEFGLVEQEKSGMLRLDLAGDAFESHLKSFTELLGQAKDRGVKEVMQGNQSAPPASAERGSSESKADLTQAMHKAMSEGNTVLYNELYDKILAAKD